MIQKEINVTRTENYVCCNSIFRLNYTEFNFARLGNSCAAKSIFREVCNLKLVLLQQHIQFKSNLFHFWMNREFLLRQKDFINISNEKCFYANIIFRLHQAQFNFELTGISCTGKVLSFYRHWNFIM